MKPNLNFHNQYECFVKQENREKAIKLINKLQSEKPDIYRQAKINIKQEGTDIRIHIDNMSAFDESTKLIILRWFNSINSYC